MKMMKYLYFVHAAVGVGPYMFACMNSKYLVTHREAIKSNLTSLVGERITQMSVHASTEGIIISIMFKGYSTRQ